MRPAGRGHPWVFMLAFGTLLVSVAAGDIGVAIACAVVIVWTVAS